MSRLADGEEEEMPPGTPIHFPEIPFESAQEVGIELGVEKDERAQTALRHLSMKSTVTLSREPPKDLPVGQRETHT